ncbi:MAG TPA: hypothetical protein VN833_04280 [Candidatus Acidoferrales bacterium]|nr:hypothetical protein [Candidatus Acidoferrales bacterium]
MASAKTIEFAKGALTFGFFVGEAIFIHWVGDVNWWISWLIAACFASVVEIQGKIRENRKLFDISDAELVRVSALANSLEEKVADLESEIESLKTAQL